MLGVHGPKAEPAAGPLRRWGCRLAMSSVAPKLKGGSSCTPPCSSCRSAAFAGALLLCWASDCPPAAALLGGDFGPESVGALPSTLLEGSSPSGNRSATTCRHTQTQVGKAAGAQSCKPGRADPTAHTDLPARAGCHTPAYLELVSPLVEADLS